MAKDNFRGRGGMKKEAFEKMIRAAVSEVFESMYFMFPEWSNGDEAKPPVPRSCFSAGVGLNGGNELVVLYASTNLVNHMAESFLGMSHGLEDEDLADVFKEACNVVAGNIVTQLNLDTSMGLGTPVVKRMSDCKMVEKCEGSVLNIEGEFLKIVVDIGQLIELQ